MTSGKSLISGRKFDLRIYVLVTSFHPLKVWLAREGFARLCGRLFDLENIGDNKAHLTNMAIQLKTDENTKGVPSTENESRKRDCKWALSKLKDYLIAHHGAEMIENLMQRITGIYEILLCPFGGGGDIEHIRDIYFSCRCDNGELVGSTTSYYAGS